MATERGLPGDGFQDSVRDLLRQRLSAVNANAVLDRARRSAPAYGVRTKEERIAFVRVLLGAARLFVDSLLLSKLEADLFMLAGGREIAPQVHEIASESDVRSCRLAVRDLAGALGARSLVQQRVATVASELARNIFAYTPGGRMELVPLPGQPPSQPAKLRLIAEDRGSGIPNLDVILAGKYRSRTGLGRGLLAAKQLMDSFVINTGAKGTRIEVEAIL